jgi:hypothetical protein
MLLHLRVESDLYRKVLDPHNLRVLFKLPKYPLSQWVGDLRIDASIADVPVSQVIGNILDAAAGFKQMHSDRMAKSMDVAGAESGLVSICTKEILNLSFLQCALSAGEEVRG